MGSCPDGGFMSKHEVFISYKYSDAWKTRDKLIAKLSNHGHFYRGERGYCPLNLADSSLKQYLADMIFGTSVTIVIISPQVTWSDWVEWEIKYSLRKTTRNGIQSQRNGIVCVIQGQDRTVFSSTAYSLKTVSSSDWAYMSYFGNKKIRKECLPEIISSNMEETFGPFGEYFGYLSSREDNYDLEDYCVVVSESTFLSNPDKYIDEAFRRAYNPEFKVHINI